MSNLQGRTSVLCGHALKVLDLYQVIAQSLHSEVLDKGSKVRNITGQQRKEHHRKSETGCYALLHVYVS